MTDLFKQEVTNVTDDDLLMFLEKKTLEREKRKLYNKEYNEKNKDKVKEYHRSYNERKKVKDQQLLELCKKRNLV